eukprot:TRINITY_DN1645_c0_g1_i4.p1 TRINITY_DN1645_c0_g1~~TRINITY_DN1645_c0_g1_i4.p1  ORF type:complete len:510 (-),score=72.25 TRINITY_DN1645_c0_g1_i4:451-1854(-)
MAPTRHQSTSQVARTLLLILFYACDQASCINDKILHHSRYLLQELTATTANEAVKELVTGSDTSKTAAEIILEYFSNDKLTEFIAGSSSLMETGGVVGLITVRRLATGIQEAAASEPNIAKNFITEVAKSDQDNVKTTYIQVFEVMWRDDGCETFGDLSTAAKNYFSATSDVLGACTGGAEDTEKDTEKLQLAPPQPEQVSSPSPIQAQQPEEAPQESQEGAQEPQQANLQRVRVKESPELQSTPEEAPEVPFEAAVETAPESSPEVSPEVSDLPPPTAEEKKASQEDAAASEVPQEVDVLTPVAQGEVDPAMIAIISAAHHSNEAASNMILDRINQGNMGTVVSSIAQTVQNGHTEAALEAMEDAIEKGLQCTDVQMILSLIAVNLSEVNLDSLAEHSRGISGIQQCLGQEMVECSTQEQVTCCSTTEPSSECTYIYAEENSVPSLGLQVLRNAAGDQLCKCPSSS